MLLQLHFYLPPARTVQGWEIMKHLPCMHVCVVVCVVTFLHQPLYLIHL